MKTFIINSFSNLNIQHTSFLQKSKHFSGKNVKRYAIIQKQEDSEELLDFYISKHPSGKERLKSKELIIGLGMLYESKYGVVDAGDLKGLEAKSDRVKGNLAEMWEGQLEWTYDYKTLNFVKFEDLCKEVDEIIISRHTGKRKMGQSRYDSENRRKFLSVLNKVTRKTFEHLCEFKEIPTIDEEFLKDCGLCRDSIKKYGKMLKDLVNNASISEFYSVEFTSETTHMYFESLYNQHLTMKKGKVVKQSWGFSEEETEELKEVFQTFEMVWSINFSNQLEENIKKSKEKYWNEKTQKLDKPKAVKRLQTHINPITASNDKNLMYVLQERINEINGIQDSYLSEEEIINLHKGKRLRKITNPHHYQVIQDYRNKRKNEYFKRRFEKVTPFDSFDLDKFSSSWYN